MLIKWIFFIFLLWYVYMLFIEDSIIIRKLSKDITGVNIPVEFRDNTTLLNELTGKFSYPNFKGIRYGANGNCTIEGKYASHSLQIQDGLVFVIRDLDTLRKSTRKKVKALREAEVISTYLEKHFNPNSEVDAYKVYQQFQAKSKKKSFVYITSTVVAIVFIGFATLEVVKEIKINSIRDAYLTQYSEEKTIGSAFNNFFSDPNWSTDGDYVYFDGNCLFDEISINMDILFEFVNDENFKINSVYINDKEVEELIYLSLLTTVFSDDARLDKSNFSETLKEVNDDESTEVKSMEVDSTPKRTREQMIETGLEILYDHYGRNIGYRFEYISTNGVETTFKIFDDSKSEPYRGNVITNDDTKTFKKDPETANEVRSDEDVSNSDEIIGDGPVLYDVALDMLYKEIGAPNANIEYIDDKDFIFEFELKGDDDEYIGTAIVDPQKGIVDISWD